MNSLKNMILESFNVNEAKLKAGVDYDESNIARQFKILDSTNKKHIGKIISLLDVGNNSTTDVNTKPRKQFVGDDNESHIYSYTVKDKTNNVGILFDGKSYGVFGYEYIVKTNKTRAWLRMTNGSNGIDITEIEEIK